MDAKVIQFDLEHLRMITGDDSEFMIEIMEMIQAESPHVVQEIKEYAERSEFDPLAKAAHKYKSSINILGNADMTLLLKNLELGAADNPNTTPIVDMVNQLDQHVAELMAWLEHQVAALKG